MSILTLLGFRGGFVEVQKMWVLSPSGNRPSFMSFLPESHVIKVVMHPSSLQSSFFLPNAIRTHRLFSPTQGSSLPLLSPSSYPFLAAYSSIDHRWWACWFICSRSPGQRRHTSHFTGVLKISKVGIDRFRILYLISFNSSQGIM